MKRTWLDKNKYILLSIFSTAFIWTILYLLLGIIFGENTILRMDLYHQYCPLFAELYDRLTSFDFSQYSWVSGLGSPFWGNFFNYLSSPIGLVVLLFGHKHVPEAIALMILIKGSLSAGAFTYYIQKSYNNLSVSSMSFGMLYAFSGFMLAYYWDVMWIDAMFVLPLLILGIEQLINKGHIQLFSISLMYAFFSNYYMSYMLCIFSVIYFLYYYTVHYSLSSKLPNAELKRTKMFKNLFLNRGFKFAFAAIIAAGVMAMFLIPTYQILQNASATKGAMPHDLSSYFNFFDFFANHLASLETTIRSSGDDVLPNVYSGIVVIVLLPMYFFTQSISKKEKVCTLITLGLFYISFNTNYLNFMWHGMHFPNDLPYRFSFIYSFFITVVAYKTFIRLNEFSSKQIGLSASAVIALIFLTDKLGSKNVESRTIYISLVLAVIYTVLLTVLKDKKYETRMVAIILCVFVAFEIIVSDTQAIKNTVTKESYEFDYDDFRSIKSKLDQIEGNNNYRMELSNLNTRMDGPWYGYNSVSVFSSMAYENTSKLENRLGEMSNDINSYTYNPQTPVFNMMHSIKYIVNNTTPNIFSDTYYKESVKVGKYTAYQNKYYLPIAYCVDNDILEWDTQFDINQHYVNPFFIQGTYFDYATGAGNPFEKLNFSYITYNNLEAFTEDINSNNYSYQKSTADTKASATFYLNAEKDGNIYVYFNIDGASEEVITFNSESSTLSPYANQDRIVDLGYHKKGESITITVPVEQNNGGIRLYPYAINDKIFNKGYNELLKGSINISEFNKDTFSGTVAAEKNCVLYTSIPYDEWWNITIDGKSVKKNDIVNIGGGLLGVKLTKGVHEIQFKYSISSLKISTGISCVCLIIFILYTVISGKKRIKYTKRAYSELEIIPTRQKSNHIATKKPAKIAQNDDSFKKEIIKPISKPLQKQIIKPKINIDHTIKNDEEASHEDIKN